MTDAEHAAHTRRRLPPRMHSNFAVRTATDEAEQLNRRGSFSQRSSPLPNEETPLLAAQANLAQAAAHDGAVDQGQSVRQWFAKAFHSFRSISPGLTSAGPEAKRTPASDAVKPRPGAFPRPVGGTAKLGTFAGVFVPTTLNVLSILMFLRFGFILGQTGVVGMMGESTPSSGL